MTTMALPGRIVIVVSCCRFLKALIDCGVKFCLFGFIVLRIVLKPSRSSIAVDEGKDSAVVSTSAMMLSIFTFFDVIVKFRP